MTPNTCLICFCSSHSITVACPAYKCTHCTTFNLGFLNSTFKLMFLKTLQIIYFLNVIRILQSLTTKIHKSEAIFCMLNLIIELMMEHSTVIQWNILVKVLFRHLFYHLMIQHPWCVQILVWQYISGWSLIIIPVVCTRKSWLHQNITNIYNHFEDNYFFIFIFWDRSWQLHQISPIFSKMD